MTVIDTLAYKIVADAQGFTRGVVATRDELRATKQIMRDSATDVGLYAAKQEALGRLHQKGLIDAAQYGEQMRKLAGSTQQAKEAAAIAAAQTTPYEKYRQELQRIEGLKGHLTIGQYTQAMRDMRVQALEAVPILGRLVKAAGEIPGVGGLMKAGISAGPKGVAAGAGAAIGGMVAATLKDIWDRAEEQVQVVKEQRGSARRLGMTGLSGQRDYMAMSGVGSKVGVDSAQLETGLYKLQEHLGDAAMGGTSARQSFENLGLSWRKLQNMPLAQQFMTVNEAIQKHGSASERAALAQDIYGKGAKELGAVLQLTRKQVEDIKAAQEKSGQLLSEADLNRINQANAAMKGYKDQQEGLYRSLAPARAEYDAFFAKVKNGWLMLFKAAGEGTAPVLKGMGLMDKGLSADASARKKREMEEDHRQALEYAKKIGDTAFIEKDRKAKGLPDDPAAARAKAEYERRAEAARQLNEDVGKLNASMQEESNTLGMTSRQAEIYRLQQRGMSSEMAAQQLRFAKQIEARKAEYDTRKDLKQQIDTFGMTAGAADNLRLRQLGVAESSIAMITAARNYVALMAAQRDAVKQATDVHQSLWTVQRQGQLQAQELQAGRHGALDPRTQASEEAAQMRRQMELAQMVRRMKSEGSSQEDINKAVALRQQTNELERMAPAIQRRQKLLDDARQAAESVRTPEQVYAENLRKFQEMLDAGGISLKQYTKLKRRAGEEMGRAMPGGDRRGGVEAIRFGSAAAADTIFQAQRQMAVLQKQAAIEAGVAKEQEAKRQQAEAAGNVDPAAASWEKQLEKMDNLCRTLERLEKNIPQLAGT